MSRFSAILLIVTFLILGYWLSAQDTLMTTYPNSEQRWEKIFVNGEKSAENIYHEDNTPWMTVQYDPSNAENWKWYHETGNPYFKATIVNELLQGRYQIWYENGKLAEDLYFKDNMENGPAVFYHDNGQIAMKGTYKMGQMVGEWQFYDEYGNKPSGKWNWVFAASMQNVRIEGQLKDGRRTGTWIYRATANQGLSTQKRFREVFD